MENAVEAEYHETGALAVAARPAAVAAWTPSFATQVDEAIEMKRQKRRFFKEVMEENLHYGVVPGTNSKPTLFKAGAEMLLANMGLHAELHDVEPPIIDVTGKDYGGEPFVYYRRECIIYRQTGPKEDDRMIVGRAPGACSSWESKYRYRDAARVCPKCKKPAIIVGKEEYGGGFLCYKKKEGCGAKFRDDDSAITGQSLGKVANPDMPDLINTILKMADKRALVAATLIATGCSDIFTQDVEDMPKSSVGNSSVRKRETLQAPSVVSLANRAKELGIQDLGAWARKNVEECADIPQRSRPTPDQCLAIARELGRMEKMAA